jgi:hypothetical protein
MSSDRVLRFDPVNGGSVEYLLPRQTNVRRAFVDDSTTPVTFWVGNNHGASIWIEVRLTAARLSVVRLCPLWVRNGKARGEHLLSACEPIADLIAR